jgi:hypothetical protein
MWLDMMRSSFLGHASGPIVKSRRVRVRIAQSIVLLLWLRSRKREGSTPIRVPVPPGEYQMPR